MTYLEYLLIANGLLFIANIAIQFYSKRIHDKTKVLFGEMSELNKSMDEIIQKTVY